MTVRKVNIERLSVISSKQFEVVVAALKAAVGRDDARGAEIRRDAEAVTWHR